MPPHPLILIKIAFPLSCKGSLESEWPMKINFVHWEKVFAVLLKMWILVKNNTDRPLVIREVDP